MPWFKISDDWIDHPKIQRAGKNGRALWVVTGNRCAKYSTDGLIEGDLVRGFAALAEVPMAATVKRLVELGIWHDHETLKRCAKCLRDIASINSVRTQESLDHLRVGPGDYYSHDWAFHQLSKARTQSPESRAAEDRLKALHKDAPLCQAIQHRDGSLCRYCGHRVNWKDRKSDRRATYDHLDPFCYAPNGGNFLEGVVTACGTCNGRKGQRTVEEWVADGGLPLRPPRWQEGDPDPGGETENIYPGSTLDLIPSREISTSGSTPLRVHGRPDAPLGPGQIGADPGVGPGQVGAGLGLAGAGRAGPALAGLGRAGPVGFGSAAGAPPPTTTEVRDADPDHRDQAQHHPPPEVSS